MRAGAGLLAGLLLTGCVNAAMRHVAAPTDYAVRVKGGVVGPDRARIVAFKGQILSSPDPDAPIDPASGDLLVDGFDVGGVNRGQAIAIDLTPATYRIAWRDVGDTGMSSPELSIPLAAGQIVYVSMDRQMPVHVGPLPVGGLVAPVAGALLPPAPRRRGPVMRLHADGSALIQAMEIVGASPRP